MSKYKRLRNSVEKPCVKIEKKPNWDKYMHDLNLMLVVSIPTYEATVDDFKNLLQNHLQYGGAINYRFEDGMTLLHKSLSQNVLIKLGIPDYLLDIGADANITDKKGQNVLLLGLRNVPYVTSSNYKELLKRLIYSTNDLEHQDNAGWGAFGIVCGNYIYLTDSGKRKLMCEIANLLLEAGVDPKLDTKWKLGRSKDQNMQNDKLEHHSRRRELMQMLRSYESRKRIRKEHNVSAYWDFDR